MLRLYNFSVRWVVHIFINDVCLPAVFRWKYVNVIMKNLKNNDRVHLQNTEMPFLLFFSHFHTIVSWSRWKADDSVDRGTWYLYSPQKYPHFTGDPLKRMVRRSHPSMCRWYLQQFIIPKLCPSVIISSVSYFTPFIRDQNQGIAEIILAKKTEFSIFSSYISHYDEKLNYLEHIQSTVRSFFSTESNLGLLLGISINQPQLFSAAVKTVRCDLCVLYCMITCECLFIVLSLLGWHVFAYFIACVLYLSY